MAESTVAPVIIVYDDDITYNQVTSQMATEDVYDKLTYELLLDEEKRSELAVQRNKPNGPYDRVLSNIFGSLLLYAGTYIMCDLYRTWKTGRWTRLIWMFLGPWNALTGAPLLHKLTDLFDTHGKGTLTHCENAYGMALKKCDLEYGALGDDHSQCRAQAQLDYQNCYMASDQFAACKEQLEAACKQECDPLYDPTLSNCGKDPDCYDIDMNVNCLGQLGYDPQ